MELQEMEITIDKDGRILVKVNGAHGDGCLELTKNLEQEAGVVEERHLLSSYYEETPPLLEQQRTGFR